jgi:hypothetical protein
MSDFQAGPGWWQASDGRGYAPEQHPDHQPVSMAKDPNDAWGTRPRRS